MHSSSSSRAGARALGYPGRLWPGAGVDGGFGGTETESGLSVLLVPLRAGSPLGGGFKRRRSLAATESALAPAVAGKLVAGFMVAVGPSDGGMIILC